MKWNSHLKILFENKRTTQKHNTLYPTHLSVPLYSWRWHTNHSNVESNQLPLLCFYIYKPLREVRRNSTGCNE